MFCECYAHSGLCGCCVEEYKMKKLSSILVLFAVLLFTVPKAAHAESFSGLNLGFAGPLGAFQLSTASARGVGVGGGFGMGGFGFPACRTSSFGFSSITPFGAFGMNSVNNSCGFGYGFGGMGFPMAGLGFGGFGGFGGGFGGCGSHGCGGWTGRPFAPFWGGARGIRPFSVTRASISRGPRGGIHEHIVQRNFI
jgi:hypothetical protein